jgi:hypothetical protein
MSKQSRQIVERYGLLLPAAATSNIHMPFREGEILTVDREGRWPMSKLGIRFANEIRHLQTREAAPESHSSYRMKITQ